MEYLTIALLVVTLAVIVWQVNSIRRLVGLVGVVRDSQCDQEEKICQLSCAGVRDSVIAGNQIARSMCQLARGQALAECNLELDSTAKAQCRREAEGRFQECIAPLAAEEARADSAYEACVRGCADKLIECRRKSLQDATLGRREELPSKADLLQPPNPPIGPRS